jgi:hypothetical protein
MRDKSAALFGEQLASFGLDCENPCSYVHNSPMNETDPSGLAAYTMSGTVAGTKYTFIIDAATGTLAKPQQDKIADAVREAVDKLNLAYTILKTMRNALMAEFPNKELDLGRMVHSDEMYHILLNRLNGVLQAIKQGKLVLEADTANYNSGTEPVLYTLLAQHAPHAAISEMRYHADFLTLPHAEMVRWSIHELGRRFAYQYYDESHPPGKLSQGSVNAIMSTVEMWDRYINIINEASMTSRSWMHS